MPTCAALVGSYVLPLGAVSRRTAEAVAAMDPPGRANEHLSEAFHCALANLALVHGQEVYALRQQVAQLREQIWVLQGSMKQIHSAALCAAIDEPEMDQVSREAAAELAEGLAQSFDFGEDSDPRDAAPPRVSRPRRVPEVCHAATMGRRPENEYNSAPVEKVLSETSETGVFELFSEGAFASRTHSEICRESGNPQVRADNNGDPQLGQLANMANHAGLPDKAVRTMLSFRRMMTPRSWTREQIGAEGEAGAKSPQTDGPADGECLVAHSSLERSVTRVLLLARTASGRPGAAADGSASASVAPPEEARPGGPAAEDPAAAAGTARAEGSGAAAAGVGAGAGAAAGAAHSSSATAADGTGGL